MTKMSYNAKENWYPKFVALQGMLKKPADIIMIKDTLLYLHSQLHNGEIYGIKSYYDEIIDNVCEDNFNICPTAKNMTVAWNLWHITRIEDLTTSILLCGDKQVFDNFKDKLGTKITDTGNAMIDDEIFSLGDELSLENMLLYRRAVGEKTKAFIENLTLDDLKRRFDKGCEQRIIDEGGVVEESKWLVDFWCRKNVSGIITMPMTKHQIMHLNDCLDIVTKYLKKQSKLKNTK